ncbi:MAG: hypothetical protein J5654_09550 [Victivallales bacterium]|nr:hypothetical protein [Victivallales bacterium]
MSYRILDNSDANSTCTAYSLSRQYVRDFGQRQIDAILQASGLMPKYRVKDARGKMHNVYSLQDAMAVIAIYRKMVVVMSGRRRVDSRAQKLKLELDKILARQRQNYKYPGESANE